MCKLKFYEILLKYFCLFFILILCLRMIDRIEENTKKIEENTNHIKENHTNIKKITNKLKAEHQ